MAIDPLNPAARLRRTLRLMQDVRLGPHGHGQLGGVSGPFGAYSNRDLLPGTAPAQTAPVTPEAVRLSHSLRDLYMQQQAQQDPGKRGAINAELQQAISSLSGLLRPRRRGGKVRATAAGGKPAATVGGRPYLP